MSQVEGKTKTLTVNDDEVKFTVYRFPPKKARKHIFKIMKVLGPSLGEVAEAAVEAKATKGDADEADIPIAKVVADIVERLDVDYAEKLMDDCAEHTHVEPGGQLHKVYDAIFLGSPRAQFQWWIFALEVQFGDFLSGWASGSPQVAAVFKAGLGR